MLTRISITLDFLVPDLPIFFMNKPKQQSNAGNFPSRFVNLFLQRNNEPTDIDFKDDERFAKTLFEYEGSNCYGQFGQRMIYQ